MKNFMGKDGFQWFVGVVEDRQDPKTLGRLKVRCLGHHTEDLNKLPTADLPWAHVMNPITSATVSGVGQSPLGVVEGTWVVGFFTDGPSAQQPVIMGTLPGVPSTLPTKDSNIGFQDVTNANYPKYKETDVNRLSVNEKDENGNEINPHSSLTIRRADRDLAVGVAQIDGVAGEILGTSGLNTAVTGLGQIDADLDSLSGGAWSEPPSPYAAEYPYNHVYESESGHVKEFDDTAGAERIHERHMSGTGYEIGPVGTKVTKVVKDNYEIISNDDFLHVRGTRRQTVDEGVRIRCNAKAGPLNSYSIEVGVGSNCNIEVNGGNVNVVAKGAPGPLGGGNINLNATGNINMKAGGSINMAAIGSITERAISRTSNITGLNVNNAGVYNINANQSTIGTSISTIINGGGEVDVNATVINLN